MSRERQWLLIGRQIGWISPEYVKKAKSDNKFVSFAQKSEKKIYLLVKGIKSEIRIIAMS